MKRTLTLIITLCLAASAGFGATQMLAMTSSPYSMAIGDCHDLLDPNVPLTRTYSGLYTLKDKTEFVFFHQILPNVGMIENGVLGLKNDWVKGIRFAAYAQYLTVGTFNSLNESGISSGSLTAYDLLIGVPIIFNPFSIPFGLKRMKEEGTNATGTEKDETDGTNVGALPSMLETVLKSSHAAVNINYFQSQLGTYSAWSLFLDVNLAMRFKFPYVGQPKPLISEDEIQAEWDRVQSNETRKIEERIAAVAGEEMYTEEEREAKVASLTERKEEIAKELERKYTRKKRDIYRVHRTRQRIYDVITRNEVALEPDYVSNFVSDVIEEIETLMDIASNAMLINNETLTAATREEINNNELTIIDYQEKLTRNAENDAVVEKSDTLFALYDDHIQTLYPYILDDEATPEKTEATAKRRGYKIYTVAADDTWKSIAQRFYDNEARYLTIVEYNNLSEETPPKEGTPLKIPFPEFIQERRQKELVFTKERNTLIRDIRRARPTKVEKLYFESTVDLYDSRLELFAYLNDIDTELDTKLYELFDRGNKLIREVRGARDALIRDLAKYKLKKDLDYLNAARDADYIEAMKDYKNNERAIFEELLLQIYKAKKEMIEDLKEEQEFKYEAHVQNIANIYERKAGTLEDTVKVRKIEAEGDDVKKKELEEDYKRTQMKLAKLRQEELNEAKEIYEAKIADYNWELNITQLIYLSSEESKDTFAVGMYVNNLGVPVTYIEEKEYLPVAFGLDVNYMFLSSERVNGYGYIHYGYSDVELHNIGLGGMARLFDFVDVRGGILFGLAPDHVETTFSLGSSIEFDLGLMNYRVDVGARFNPLYGSTMSVGLNIIF